MPEDFHPASWYATCAVQLHGFPIDDGVFFSYTTSFSNIITSYQAYNNFWTDAISKPNGILPPVLGIQDVLELTKYAYESIQSGRNVFSVRLIIFILP